MWPYLVPGGEYLVDAQVGHIGWCGRGAQTLTLFKTQISDFPTPFKVITVNCIAHPFCASIFA